VSLSGMALGTPHTRRKARGTRGFVAGGQRARLTACLVQMRLKGRIRASYCARTFQYPQRKTGETGSEVSEAPCCLSRNAVPEGDDLLPDR